MKWAINLTYHVQNALCSAKPTSRKAQKWILIQTRLNHTERFSKIMLVKGKNLLEKFVNNLGPNTKHCASPVLTNYSFPSVQFLRKSGGYVLGKKCVQMDHLNALLIKFENFFKIENFPWKRIFMLAHWFLIQKKAQDAYFETKKFFTQTKSFLPPFFTDALQP